MVDKRNAGAAAPQVNAPEVMMPQESRAEVDRLVGVPAGLARRRAGRRAVRLKRGAEWG